MSEYAIKHVGDHYEVYINGEFYCSADTMIEAANEITQYIEEHDEEE